jgi:hypothetical protein
MCYNELLLGCGSSRVKKIVFPGTSNQWKNLITIDNNKDHNPNIVYDLESKRQTLDG